MSDSLEEVRGGARLRWVRRAVAVAFLIAVAALLWSVWDHEAVMEWTREAGPLPFFAMMAVLPAIGVPITPFFILAGATFGIQLGILLAITALAANLTVCYWIARKLRPIFASLLGRLGYDLPNLGSRDKGVVRFALTVKLAPGVPGFVKNYGLGVAGVPFPLYLALSLFITGVYAILLVVLGESLLTHDRGQALLAAAFVAILAFGLWWWRRRRRGA